MKSQTDMATKNDFTLFADAGIRPHSKSPSPSDCKKLKLHNDATQIEGHFSLAHEVLIY